MDNDKYKDIGIAVDRDEWTREYFVDQLFLCLVSVTEQITNSDGEKLFVKKYYRRARHILKVIPILRPPPLYIINISDLAQRLVEEFKEVSDYKTRSYVLIQAVGRIFENLDFEYYHLSIARNLRVGFEK